MKSSRSHILGTALCSLLASACGQQVVQLEINADMGAATDFAHVVDFSGVPVDFAGIPRDLTLIGDLRPATGDMTLNGPLDFRLAVDLELLDSSTPLDLPVSLDMSPPDLSVPLDGAADDLSIPADARPQVDAVSVDGMSLDAALPLDLQGSPDLTGGPNNYNRCPAVLFDGAMSLVTASAIAALNPASSITVEAWIYVTVENGEMIIAGHTGDPAQMTASYYLGVDAGGHAFFTVSVLGTLLDTATAAAAVSLNKWTHVAGVFDVAGQRVAVFMNGALSGQKNPVVGVPRSINNVPLHIGRYSAATPAVSELHGYVSEVRFSSVARYAAPFAPAGSFVNDASTIALYHLMEQMGQTAADSSTNANVGALQLNAQFANAPVCQ